MIKQNTKQQQPKEKVHKYNAQKIKIDDVTFDSKYEALYYTEVIKPGVQNGSIIDVIFHPKYLLLPKFQREIDGKDKKFGAMTYSADFKVTYADGSETIIDIKGMVTKDFKMKYKLFHYLYDDLSIVLLKPRIRKSGTIWEKVDA